MAVVEESCLKKPQNTRMQQMVFTQPVKLVVVGEVGQRRLEIPVCVCGKYLLNLRVAQEIFLALNTEISKCLSEGI